MGTPVQTESANVIEEHIGILDTVCDIFHCLLSCVRSARDAHCQNLPKGVTIAHRSLASSVSSNVQCHSEMSNSEKNSQPTHLANVSWMRSSGQKRRRITLFSLRKSETHLPNCLSVAVVSCHCQLLGALKHIQDCTLGMTNTGDAHCDAPQGLRAEDSDINPVSKLFSEDPFMCTWHRMRSSVFWLSIQINFQMNLPMRMVPKVAIKKLVNL